MSNDLAEFLLARIAEDEAIARAVDLDHYRQDSSPMGGETWDDVVPLLVAFSPARVLAECEAKRRIVEEYRTAIGLGHGSTTIGHMERCLWALALPYSDHPDYREEWRP